LGVAADGSDQLAQEIVDAEPILNLLANIGLFASIGEPFGVSNTVELITMPCPLLTDFDPALYIAIPTRGKGSAGRTEGAPSGRDGKVERLDASAGLGAPTLSKRISDQDRW